MDKKDLQIIALLQQDASISLAELAEAVNLSPTPCWRRLQKLREDGVITRQVALCDAERLKLGVTVFVTIRTSRHSDDWTRQFIEGTRDIPEIVEIYRMTGDVDYLLKIVVPDIKGYDAVYKRLIRVADLSDVSSGFAMEVIKHTTALPLDHLTQAGDS
ncbi:Lrp/AsnC family transcriptional regulator [Metapseudomonas lalkuanensis]|uniref:Lrp/AsnC family transcriptional regulator n=1 Tax=Metapseudomonas lalkuanensis TaxID=2604832 RepID=A0A5J6QNS4_9GAMM|nr:Lrp/AsnC family transcriptional regulator [Pseudomonas lalkuanensis]QEY64130.1 Lrp/AsnC family transcriptional regulator [Pseudomonas lalkuanensis]UCO96750.1 Lrp/AsnC family transcriptional regulator [Pseudomonas lalkuanensis]